MTREGRAPRLRSLQTLPGATSPEVLQLEQKNDRHDVSKHYKVDGEDPDGGDLDGEEVNDEALDDEDLDDEGQGEGGVEDGDGSGRRLRSTRTRTTCNWPG